MKRTAPTLLYVVHKATLWLTYAHGGFFFAATKVNTSKRTHNFCLASSFFQNYSIPNWTDPTKTKCFGIVAAEIHRPEVLLSTQSLNDNRNTVSKILHTKNISLSLKC